MLLFQSQKVPYFLLSRIQYSHPRNCPKQYGELLHWFGEKCWRGRNWCTQNCSRSCCYLHHAQYASHPHLHQCLSQSQTLQCHQHCREINYQTQGELHQLPKTLYHFHWCVRDCLLQLLCPHNRLLQWHQQGSSRNLDHQLLHHHLLHGLPGQEEGTVIFHPEKVWKLCSATKPDWISEEISMVKTTRHLM